MKFVIAIAIICTFGFSAVQSAKCDKNDNAADYVSCNLLVCNRETTNEGCGKIDVAARDACKDHAVSAFKLADSLLSCECSEMTCVKSDVPDFGKILNGKFFEINFALPNGAAFEAMSFIAVFVGLLL